MQPDAAPFPDDLVLEPVSRWPTTLADQTRRVVLQAPVAQRLRAVSTTPRPLVSIVIVTFDGLVYTRLCLESLLTAGASMPCEVIVVDNGSSDGTRDYLGQVGLRDVRVRPVFNDRNAGFAAATNQGAALARGNVLVLLNNDTIVPAGWLEGLTSHLGDDRIGVLGAVTNRAGNEAEIDVTYRTYGGFRQFARHRTRAQSPALFDVRTVTMFCAAMRREVWERLGPLDERFEVGLFEDDDYSMRARQAGYRVACAEDVFLHHFGQASIGRLGPTGEYGPLFHANRARWEAKWGVAWQPYARRVPAAYRALVDDIRHVVRETVPLEATMVVVSRGDEELLNLSGRRAWHCPRSEDGAYAGHHPADSAACIAGLEALRALGGTHLVVPATMKWWLEHYPGFREHLAARYRVVADHEACLIVALTERAGPQAGREEEEAG